MRKRTRILAVLVGVVAAFSVVVAARRDLAGRDDGDIKGDPEI